MRSWFNKLPRQLLSFYDFLGLWQQFNDRGMELKKMRELTLLAIESVPFC